MLSYRWRIIPEWLLTTMLVLFVGLLQLLTVIEQITPGDNSSEQRVTPLLKSLIQWVIDDFQIQSISRSESANATTP